VIAPEPLRAESAMVMGRIHNGWAPARRLLHVAPGGTSRLALRLVWRAAAMSSLAEGWVEKGARAEHGGAPAERLSEWSEGLR